MNNIVLMMGGVGGGEALFALGIIVLLVVCWWKIFSKVGYSGAMGLMMLIPLVNLVMLMILAFGRWPIHRWLLTVKSATKVPDTNYDKVMKLAVKLETRGELEKALTEYQHIVEDAQTCVNAIRVRLAELKKRGAI